MKTTEEKTKEYVDYMPAADIIAIDNAVKLYLDLPGANKDCLDINIDDHVLSVTADTGIMYEGKSLRYSNISPLLLSWAIFATSTNLSCSIIL